MSYPNRDPEFGQKLEVTYPAQQGPEIPLITNAKALASKVRDMLLPPESVLQNPIPHDASGSDKKKKSGKH
jgi:hypothetical protein